MKQERLDHHILLLMLNLSQMSDKGKIIELFVDGINSLSADFSLRLLNEGEDSQTETIKIATTRNYFGYFAFEGDLPKLPSNFIVLIKNSIQMLAIILENSLQAKLLANENIRLDRAVREQTSKLRSLASELSLAEEKERRRIAVGLHDDIGQNLYASKMKLEWLFGTVSPDDLDGSIKEVIENIDQTIHHIRTMTFELSPPVLYELGFGPALKSLTDHFTEQFGISSFYENDNHPKPLSIDVQVLLYQSVRELLTNIVKHARAHMVEVSVRRDVHNIRIDVNDDGLGFNTSQVSSNIGADSKFGLFNIRERLVFLGGRLDIKSTEGQGTRVSLVTPLQNNESDRPPDII